MTYTTGLQTVSIINAHVEITPLNPTIPPSEILISGVKNGDLESVKSSLINGADANGFYGNDHVLHIACEKGNLDIVCELIERGADFNKRSWKFNDTPLHRACMFGHTKIAEKLIQCGAGLNVRNGFGWRTPLETAISFGFFECCKLLLVSGAKINEINLDKHSTPLTDACEKGVYEIVQLLLDNGAEPNLCSKFTPLYKAVPFPEILQLLLDKGGQVDCKNRSDAILGESEEPLHGAVSGGYVKSVEILLKAGANPKVTNICNKTPLDTARWRLDGYQTDSWDSPIATAQKIKNLEIIIKILESL